MECIDQSTLLVMMGGYDAKIHVYTSKRGVQEDLKFQFSMLGHFNSIKDLSVSPPVDGQVRYLASGS
jgi:hypothetical protein